MTLLYLLQSLVLAALVVLLYLFKKALPSYLSEKGKNLATKQDIEEITEIVESVKSRINQGAEAQKLSLKKELQGFSTQFSRLDHQRSTGVMEIHGLMCEIEQFLIWNSSSGSTASVSVNPEARTMEALNKAWEGVAKLNQILNYHSLLLNEQIYVRVQSWSREMMTVASAIGNKIEPLRKSAGNTQASLNEREAAISIIRQEFLDTSLNRLGKIRKELEAEFRAILATEATRSEDSAHL